MCFQTYRTYNPKSEALVGDVENGGGCVCVQGQETNGNFLSLLLNFAVKLKLL